MKKILILLALSLSINANSQITLEHTYTVANTNAYLTGCNLANSGFKYQITDLTAGQIKLYNLNHSLWKTISIPPIASFTILGVYNISENLFNTDGQVEFLVYYYTTVAPTQYYVKVYTETGTVIGDFPNRAYSGVFDTGSNGIKLFLNDLNLSREVWSLPGTSTNLGLNDDDEFISNQFAAYPNPTNNIISIPYTFSQGINGQIIVYGSNGQIIKTFNVDSNFSSLELDVTNYASGTYYYTISNGATVSEPSTFIKN